MGRLGPRACAARGEEPAPELSAEGVGSPNDMVSVNTILVPESGGTVAAALAPLSSGLFRRVRFVRADPKELTLVLQTGLEIRFGDIHDVRLKVAIARRILGVIGPYTTTGYVDVSVPERPVVKAP